MKYTISEMGLGEILDQTIALLRNHFWLLMKIALYLSIPFSLAYNFFILALRPDVGPEMAPDALMAALAFIAFPTLIYILLYAFIVQPVTTAATIRAISREYLGEPTTAGKSLKFAFKKLGALILTNLYAGILIFLGYMLCLIPGIYLAFRYWFVTHAVVIEETSGGPALKRSGALMKGNMGKAFVLGLILAAIMFGIVIMASFIPVPAISSIVQVLLQSVTMALGTAAAVVFYFSCRCGRENFDLTLLADAMGEDVPTITPEDQI